MYIEIYIITTNSYFQGGVMKNKIGIGIVLISLLILVSSQVLAAPPTDTICKGKCAFFFPLNIGDLFIYGAVDSGGNRWNMYFEISGEAKIAMNSTTYATFEVRGYDYDMVDKISLNLGRSTANEFYNYNGNGEEHLVWRNASVSTFWTYVRYGHAEKRKVEAIEDIATLAGTFFACLKICNYGIDDLANPILYTCEWIKPGFGMVKEVDYYTDNATVEYKLIGMVR